MINIKNLNFNYHDKVIFDNFNLIIKRNKITSIIGANGSGKSTLIEILTGILEFKGQIEIDGVSLNKHNLKEIRKKIGVVFESKDSQFITETVMDEIAFVLENLNYNKKEIKKRVEKIAKILDIDDVLEVNPYSLNLNQQQLVHLACALVHEPKILILDETLCMLNPITLEKVLDLIKKLNKEGMTIIIITHDIEHTLISDEILLLDSGKVILNDNRENIYKEEQILNKLGFKLPFMVELSNRLKFYDLIDKTIYDMKEMVEILWK